MNIEHEEKSSSSNDGNSYNCASSICSSLPSCPDKLKAENGYKIACGAFSAEEYYCTSEYNFADKSMPINSNLVVLMLILWL